MAYINQLPLLDEVSPGDNLVVYAPNSGDTRRLPVSELTEYLQDQLNAPGFQNQYAAPSVSGTVVTVRDDSDDTWLILQPVAAYAAMTILLPALANCMNGQELLVNCTQSVTTLTTSGNGATVVGAPTTLAANAFFRLKFDSLSDTWFRVG